MADIFLSYKSEDEKIARTIVGIFEKAGVTVWWDEKLTPKAHWDRLIETEIKAAKVVLVLWSAKSSMSDWVRAEANFAIENDKLVQAKLDNGDPPLLYAMRQYADLSDWRGQANHKEIAKLFEWMSHIASRNDGDLSAKLLSWAKKYGSEDDPEIEFQSSTAQQSIQPGSTVDEATAPGTLFRDVPWGPLMVVLPAGEFAMGNLTEKTYPSEEPKRQVTIGSPFAMGVYPVTFMDWDTALSGNVIRYSPKDLGWGRTDRPVIHVSQSDALEYAHWLSEQTHEDYRLPSEAEWEYACRAGTVTSFYSGDTLAVAAENSKLTVRRGTRPVGTSGPNEFGLYDMHGNVWEWTADNWHDNYQGAPDDQSPWISSNEQRNIVIRGGAWGHSEKWLRSSARDFSDKNMQSHSIGFRLARSL